MRFLRQNTAVIISVGPFYDKTDGVTIETGLTITNERITLTADTDAGSAPTNILDNVTGATSATANDLNYITGNDAGMMQLELAAADTNRVGRMMLSITDAANHVPVFHEFFVLPQAIFDWLTGVIVPLPANVTTIAGAAVSTSTAQLGVNVVNAAGTAWGSGAITAASIATGAIDADAIADNAIDAGAIATGAITNAKFAAGAIDAASIANAAIDFATFAADCKTGTGLKANVESVTNDAITAAAIANAAIDNATFAADVGSTALATNMIAKAAEKAVGVAGVSLTNTGIPAATVTALGTGAGLTTLATAAELAKVPKSDSNVTFNATALASINAEVDTALNTAIPGSPTADSINERIVAIDAFGAPPSAATVADAVWDEASTGHTDAGKAGLQLWTDIDAILADTGELQTNQGAWATATGFSTHSAADVWSVATRALTDKADFALSSASRDAIWDQASGITLSFEALLSRTYEILAHKMTVTDATGIVALLGTDNATPIATGSVTDNSTTTTRLELTWV